MRTREKEKQAALPFVKARFGHVLLLYRPFSHFYGCHDRLGQWLSIFLLYERLDVGPVHLTCRGIILFVLM
jgi:hypothetical protein